MDSWPLLFFLSLCHRALAQEEYKLGVIYDPKFTKVEQLYNLTEKLWSGEDHHLSFLKIDSIGSNAQTKTCGAIKANGVQMLLSYARDSQTAQAAKQIAASSGIPTIQIYPLLWSSNAVGESDDPGNYVEAVPTNFVMDTFFPDFLTQAGIEDYGILSDGFYEMDLSAMLALAGGHEGKVLAQRTFNDSTTPQALMGDFQREGVEDIVMVMQTRAAEKFFQLVRSPSFTTFTSQADASLQTSFRWFLFSPDARPFTCSSCEWVHLWWVRPNHWIREANGNPMDEPKDYINFEHEKYDVLNMETEVGVGFYYGLLRIAEGYLTKLNGTEGLPSFECGTAPTLSQNLVKFVANMELTYGKFILKGNLAYQNLDVRVVKVEFYGDTRYVRRIGTWKPGESYVATYPFNVNISTLTVFDVQPPFVERMAEEVPPYLYKPAKFKGVQYYYRGYCIELIQRVIHNGEAESSGSAQLFSYNLHEAPDGLYGTMSGRDEWNGLIQELITGEAQIALAALSVMAERENFVDFTVPYYDLVGTSILMLKNKPTYNLFRFLSVLEGEVWACIIAAYFFTSFLLWIFDKFSPYSYTNNKEKYRDDPEKREFTLRECLWFCMTSLTPQGGGEAPKNISGRLVAATWWLFGFIIIASYTANLAAFLTVNRRDNPINSLDDLAAQYRVKYAPAKGTSSEVYFRRMAEIEDKFYEIWKSMSLNDSMSPQERAKLAVWDYPVSDKYTSIWRYMQSAGLPRDNQEAIDRVYANAPGSKTEFAYVGDATEIKYATITNCSFRQVGKEFSRKPYAIAVQQGSPLKDTISKAILKLLNQRDLERLKENWWTKNPNKVDCPKDEEATAGISIRNIGGVFIVILVGIGLSVIALVFEYSYYRNKRNEVAVSATPGDKEGNGDTRY